MVSFYLIPVLTRKAARRPADEPEAARRACSKHKAPQLGYGALAE
jgi:hypothetical protein